MLQIAKLSRFQIGWMAKDTMKGLNCQLPWDPQERETVPYPQAVSDEIECTLLKGFGFFDLTFFKLVLFEDRDNTAIRS